mmetsp:Transcript_16725/g.49054  ORF Transcript_16725/g.49054 Transcript_16725/m.49054 type:complete len:356 (+) Transcript_16725:222-1289(+)
MRQRLLRASAVRAALRRCDMPAGARRRGTSSARRCCSPQEQRSRRRRRWGTPRYRAPASRATCPPCGCSPRTAPAAPSSSPTPPSRWPAGRATESSPLGWHRAGTGPRRSTTSTASPSPARGFSSAPAPRHAPRPRALRTRLRRSPWRGRARARRRRWCYLPLRCFPRTRDTLTLRGIYTRHSGTHRAWPRLTCLLSFSRVTRWSPPQSRGAPPRTACGPSGCSGSPSSCSRSATCWRGRLRRGSRAPSPTCGWSTSFRWRSAATRRRQGPREGPSRRYGPISACGRAGVDWHSTVKCRLAPSAPSGRRFHFCAAQSPRVSPQPVARVRQAHALATPGLWEVPGAARRCVIKKDW